MGKKGAKKQVQDEAESESSRKLRAAPRELPQRVIGFYGSARHHKFCEFSNFYDGVPPFDFYLPQCARKPGYLEFVSCAFSEKAIMLTKAALMDDAETFQKIAESTDPKTAKALGRCVEPWKQELWDEHLEDIAFEVVRQKFAASAALRDVLFSTGEHILAEATRNDCIWGIGINVGDDRVQDPKQWCGRNVLGYALMRARDHLRGRGADPASSSSGSGAAASSGYPAASSGGVSMAAAATGTSGATSSQAGSKDSACAENGARAASEQNGASESEACTAPGDAEVAGKPDEASASTGGVRARRWGNKGSKLDG